MLHSQQRWVFPFSNFRRPTSPLWGERGIRSRIFCQKRLVRILQEEPNMRLRRRFWHQVINRRKKTFLKPTSPVMGSL